MLPKHCERRLVLCSWHRVANSGAIVPEAADFVPCRLRRLAGVWAILAPSRFHHRAGRRLRFESCLLIVDGRLGVNHAAH